jgi:hypothetical protein
VCLGWCNFSKVTCGRLERNADIWQISNWLGEHFDRHLFCDKYTVSNLKVNNAINSLAVDPKYSTPIMQLQTQNVYRTARFIVQSGMYSFHHIL